MTKTYKTYSISEFEHYINNTNFTRKINLIQQHHTWKPSYKNFKVGCYAAMLEGMRQYHVDTMHYSDIAQNITIFPDGVMALCRDINIAPAGIYGANSNGICIENVGNFDPHEDIMTPAHSDAIVSINAILCRKFKLVPSTSSIVYHHWYNMRTGARDNEDGKRGLIDNFYKSCPGSTGFYGGNTTASCDKYLIPLIKAKLI